MELEIILVLDHLYLIYLQSCFLKFRINLSVYFISTFKMISVFTTKNGKTLEIYFAKS